MEKLKQTAEYIKNKLGTLPKIAIILGSGLGGLANKINIEQSIAYSDIPNFPLSTVQGHKSCLIYGELGGKKVLAMQGRFHYYEGYEMWQVVFPVRVFKLLGIEYLIVSNAAGGLNPAFSIGDIMLIHDHINFFPVNPLRGKNYDEFGVRFPDMSKTYNPELLEKTKKIAQENSIKVQTGVYIGSSGPTLETFAEYSLFRSWGADATGMSTVPEVIVAHHAGIKVLGISVITNLSKPATPGGETTHDEVINVAEQVEPKLIILIRELISQIC